MKQKILIIPADSISNKVSRSFYFGKYLAIEHDVYMLRWYDPQSVEFSLGRGSKYNTLSCFIRSVLQRSRTVDTDEFGIKYLNLSRLSHMILYRLIGTVAALKLARMYNRWMLLKVTKQHRFDVIFYADGFDSFPLVEGQHLSISDVQDDFDSSNFRNNSYQRIYGHDNFSQSAANFVVSRGAKEKMEQYYNCLFEYLPNGADLDQITAAGMPCLNDYGLKDLRNSGKKIVTYIGGRAWYDEQLAMEVFELCDKKSLNVHFIIIGNLPKNNASNVTFLGALPNQETYSFYLLTDIGLLLKDSGSSHFLRNSMPLKIIQYSMARSAVVCPYISWLDEEGFDNVTMIKPYSAEAVVADISQKLESPYVTYDERWNKYSWSDLVNRIHLKITST